MEWKDLIIVVLACASFLWGVYVFRRTRADKTGETHATVEIAHLTDGAQFRKDLIERLNDASERIDKLESQNLAANERISGFQATVNELVLENKLLEREKKILREDLERRDELFKAELEKKERQHEKEMGALKQRIAELEREVGELKQQHV